LCDAGAHVDESQFAELDEIPEITRGGGFAAAESYAWHEHMLAGKEHDYDPRVVVRIKRGKEQSAVDYIRLVEARRGFIDRVEQRLAPYDFVAFPSVPVSPPRLLELASDEAYNRINLLCLRNSSIVNLWDGCAVSIPITAPGEVPAGITLASRRGQDEILFGQAHDFEQIIAQD
jgi:aspartyl-tRNA(Asn)/glutamyl-tRNA(Gln) amidotransferase subunit A